MTETEETKEQISQVHNNMFTKVFSELENVRAFLNLVLPQRLKESLDLSHIEIEFTNYISEALKNAYSDLVVKTRLINPPTEKKSRADIYILLEHKSSPEKKSLVQVLKYMYLEWQNDLENGLPLRPIIPMIFYHGKKKWNLPLNFVDQFNVDPAVKEYLLNFNYVLFNTDEWDFFAEENSGLKENVFLLTALTLMKNAFNDDRTVVDEILKFWHRKGFTNNREIIITCLTYMLEIRDISLEELQKSWEESKIDGGDVMPSLAQRLRDEGKEQGLRIGIEKGKMEGKREGKMEGKREGKREGRMEGKREGKIETVLDFLRNGVDVNTVVKATGLSLKELEKLMKSVQTH